VKGAALPTTVFRLGRRPDPWVWPDWAYADPDGTFGNRFDDPLGIYRVLYASTQRLATFVECLAYFRPDPEVIAGLAQIAGAADPDEPPAAGLVPREWVSVRCVGAGRPTGRYVDVGHHETLAELRLAFAPRILHYRLLDLDGSAIRLTAPRAFTQEISRYVFERSVSGQREWNGLAYRSKHGDDFENWAIFEPEAPVDQTVTNFAEDDPDLAAALRLHGLTLG
jgi:hypothetical protein